MNMWNRFKDSLITPKNIVEYRNDSLWWVFLYIIVFALLLSTRTTITTLTFDGLSPADREIIAQDLADVNDGCAMESGVFDCDEAATQLIYEDLLLGYYLESNDTLQYDNYERDYSVVVFQENVLFVFNDTILFEVLIADLDPAVQNLDFALQETDEDVFHDAIFRAVDQFILSYRSTWTPLVIAIDVITSFVLFLLFILVSAWMLRLRFREVRFRQLFTMTSYSSTGLYLILIFDSLFNLSFLLVILLILFAFRQNNQLSMELYRRLNQNKKP